MTVYLKFPKQTNPQRHKVNCSFLEVGGVGEWGGGLPIGMASLEGVGNILN